MALYYTVTSKRNPHLWPYSAIYSGYSTHAAMMQYEMDDVTHWTSYEEMMQSEDGCVHFHGESVKVNMSML